MRCNEVTQFLRKHIFNSYKVQEVGSNPRKLIITHFNAPRPAQNPLNLEERPLCSSKDSTCYNRIFRLQAWTHHTEKLCLNFGQLTNYLMNNGGLWQNTLWDICTRHNKENYFLQCGQWLGLHFSVPLPRCFNSIKVFMSLERLNIKSLSMSFWPTLQRTLLTIIFQM